MSERYIHMRYGTQSDTDTRYSTGEVTTLLWENSDPTASFSAQDIDLGQSAEGFKYLRIVWSDSTGSDTERIVDYDLENIDSYIGGTDKGRLSFEHYASTYRYERSAYFIDDNYDSLHFYNAIRVVTNSSNVGSSASQCIPVAIYGVNIGQVLNSSGSGSGGSGETYTGAYTVTPQAWNQTVLDTAGKVMSRNVTVLEVPYYETSNTDGTTVYIAQEVE